MGATGCGSPRPEGVRHRLTRPAWQGWQIDAKGCGGASTIAAGAVGIERPGLKPRAQSASPLKGAVRRPGARVDRLGAGAVGISRLQPAWGMSPAVHGRAVVERVARLVCDAYRARRVGRVESPRHAARAGEAAPRPYKRGVVHPRSGILSGGGAPRPSCRGQAVPDPPARRAGNSSPIDAVVLFPTTVWVIRHDALPRRPARAGEEGPRPDKVGRPIPGRTCGCDGGALAPAP